MLVEDEADIVLLFKMILKSDVGVKVEQFTDPLAALNNFKSGLYDLIMIDIALPKINGFELYYKIRKLDDRVKVCFLTAGEMYYEDIRKKVVPGLDTNCFIRRIDKASKRYSWVRVVTICHTIKVYFFIMSRHSYK